MTKLYVLHRKGRILVMILLDTILAAEVMVETNLEAGGVKIIKVAYNLFSNNTKTKIRNLYNAIDVEKWLTQLVFAELLGRRFMIRKRRINIHIRNHQRKVILLNMHIILSHIVILALKNFLVLLFLGMILGY